MLQRMHLYARLHHLLVREEWANGGLLLFYLITDNSKIPGPNDKIGIRHSDVDSEGKVDDLCCN